MLLSWASYRGHLPDIVVAGEKGTLHLWPGAHYYDYYPTAPSLKTQLAAQVRPYWLQEKLLRPSLQRRRIKLRDKDVTGYLGEMQEFLAAVAEQRQPVSTGQDGRRDLELVRGSYEALTVGIRTGIPAIGKKKQPAR
jgi:predicted dehydrogenase